MGFTRTSNAIRGNRFFRFRSVDPTKVWPEDRFPLMEVGTMTLNRNPKNFFAEVEQVAFSQVQL